MSPHEETHKNGTKMYYLGNLAQLVIEIKDLCLDVKLLGGGLRLPKIVERCQDSSYGAVISSS